MSCTAAVCGCMHVRASVRNLHCVHVATYEGAEAPPFSFTNLPTLLTMLLCSSLPASCGLVTRNGPMADHQVALMGPHSAVTARN